MNRAKRICRDYNYETFYTKQTAEEYGIQLNILTIVTAQSFIRRDIDIVMYL